MSCGDTCDLLTRAVALTIAGLVVGNLELDPPGDVADLEEITAEMAERFASWLATGRKTMGEGQ